MEIRTEKYNTKNFKFDRLNSSMEMTEKRISEVDHRTIKITQYEQQKENRPKNDSESFGKKDLAFMALESQKKKKETGMEKYSKK